MCRDGVWRFAKMARSARSCHPKRPSVPRCSVTGAAIYPRRNSPNRSSSAERTELPLGGHHVAKEGLENLQRAALSN